MSIGKGRVDEGRSEQRKRGEEGAESSEKRKEMSPLRRRGAKEGSEESGVRQKKRNG
mgnify:CR=1 FL=1